MSVNRLVRPDRSFWNANWNSMIDGFFQIWNWREPWRQSSVMWRTHTFPHLKGKGHLSGLGVRIKFPACGRAASTGLGLLTPPTYSKEISMYRTPKFTFWFLSCTLKAREVTWLFFVPPKRVQACICRTSFQCKIPHRLLGPGHTPFTTLFEA